MKNVHTFLKIFKFFVGFVIYENLQFFAIRIQELTRTEIKEILDTYGMTEYNDFELLQRSVSNLSTDIYEFDRNKITRK